MISIDLSMRSTGYCVWKEGKLIAYGIINTDKNHNTYERANYVAQTLISLIKEYKITEVFIEAPAFAAKGSMVYSLQGSHFYVTCRIFLETGITAKQVAITTIKKQFTGNGRAEKKAIMEHMPKDILEEFQKHYVVSRGLTDLCDAYALGAIQFN